MNAQSIYQKHRKSALQVQRALFSSRKVGTERSLPRGRLDSTRLHRVALGETKVFQRKVEAPAVSASVCLLVDHSRSMNEWAGAAPRYDVAVAAAMVLAEALQVPGVRTQVIAFAEGDRYHDNALIHHPLQDYGQRFDTKRIQSESDRTRVAANCNSDGETLAIAHADMTRETSKRKIIIIISDGCPRSVAADYGDYMRAEDYTKQVIEMIEADPSVELHALGIGDFENPGYTNVQIADDPDKLSDALLALVAGLAKH